MKISREIAEEGSEYRFLGMFKAVSISRGTSGCYLRADFILLSLVCHLRLRFGAVSNFGLCTSTGIFDADENRYLCFDELWNSVRPYCDVMNAIILTINRAGACTIVKTVQLVYLTNVGDPTGKWYLPHGVLLCNN